MFKSRIHPNDKTGSKSLRSNSTAVTGSTNSKSTAENLLKADSEANLNWFFELSNSKTQLNLKEMVDCLEEYYKNNSNKLETIAEGNEENKSEESKSSGNSNQQPIIEEVHETAKEIKQRMFYF